MEPKTLIKVIRILALIIWIPAIASYILFSFGKLKLEYMVVINLSVLILEVILFIISMKIISKYTKTVTKGVVVPKGKFDDMYIVANNEILSHGVKPIHPWKDSIFRVIMELVPDAEDRPLKFYIIRKCSMDACEQEIDIIKPSDSSKHVFELNIDPKELINFKFSRDTIVKSFTVDELYIP